MATDEERAAMGLMPLSFFENEVEKRNKAMDEEGA